MEWTQFIIFFLGIFGLWLWQRTESRADARKYEADLKEFRERWAEESKDFHGRLIKIEEEFKAFMKQQEEKRTRILEGR